jgi:hypothetical protein
MNKVVATMLNKKDLQAIAGLINQSVTQSENRMKAYIDEQVSGSEKRIMTYIESNVEKKIQLLAEGHRIIIDKFPDVNEQEQLKSRVKVLERVTTDLREELDELKKAQ